MDAAKVVDMLSDRDIWDLLESLDAKPEKKGNTYVCETVCHCGDKKKLFYYRDSKNFYCYTNCGSMSIFDFVSNTLDLTFIESLRYITKKYNIRDNGHFEEGFVFDKVENPGELLNKKLQRIEFPKIEVVDESVLKDFYNLYHKMWIKEGITVKSMKKYGILYSILDNQIIIPHRNEYGELIGVRCRNLKKELVDDGKKYMPIYYEGKTLKHPTGANLFGLDKNRQSIKKLKTCILFESEKSVLALDSMFPDASIGLCVSGSNLTVYQLELLKKLNIEEVIIGVDKEFKEFGSEEEIFYADKIKAVFKNKLAPWFKVSILWDTKNLLEQKDSPVDKGKFVFEELLKNRIIL